MGGYQSESIITGDLPLMSMTGGHGRTDAREDQDYTVNLETPITAYENGLTLWVTFEQTNKSDPTINVDSLGAVDILVHLGEGEYVSLPEGVLIGGRTYILVYKGRSFEIINLYLPTQVATEAQVGVARFANSTETVSGNANDLMVSVEQLNHKLSNQLMNWSPLILPSTNIHSSYAYSGGNSRLDLIGGILLIPGNLTIMQTANNGVLYKAHVMAFPKPFDGTMLPSGELQSVEGEKFTYMIDHNGKFLLNGMFNSSTDTLPITINPYVIKTPIEFEATPF